MAEWYGATVLAIKWNSRKSQEWKKKKNTSHWRGRIPAKSYNTATVKIQMQNQVKTTQLPYRWRHTTSVWDLVCHHLYCGKNSISKDWLPPSGGEMEPVVELLSYWELPFSVLFLSCTAVVCFVSPIWWLLPRLGWSSILCCLYLFEETDFDFWSLVGS